MGAWSKTARADPRPPAGARSWVRRAIAILVIGLVLYLAWVVWERGTVLAWLERARPAWFFSAMAILPAIGVPTTPLFVLAGASFGTRVALVGSGLALGANLALCYFIARSRLRPRLESLLRRLGYELPRLEAASRKAVRLTLMVKLTPGLPTFVKNYALGSAGVPFFVYFASSLLITGTYAVLLIVMGESLFDHDLRKLALAAAAIVALAAGVTWWRRRRAVPASS